MLQERLNECRVLMAEVSQNKQKDNEHQNVVRKNNTFFDTYSNFFVPIIKGYAQCKKYDHICFSEKTIEDLQKYALMIDDVLRPLGWRRTSSGELYDNQSTMIQKIMNYEALALETF